MTERLERWVHVGDHQMDAIVHDDFDFPGDEEELVEGPSEREVVQDVIRRIALFTLPGVTDRLSETRRYRAGYIRWIALIYLTNRDLFGGKSQESVAKSLGIAPCTLSKHVRRLREQGISYGEVER